MLYTATTPQIEGPAPRLVALSIDDWEHLVADAHDVERREDGTHLCPDPEPVGAFPRNFSRTRPIRFRRSEQTDHADAPAGGHLI